MQEKSDHFSCMCSILGLGIFTDHLGDEEKQTKTTCKLALPSGIKNGGGAGGSVETQP
jgi:hypothetical protein